jgi:hypothetical protein
MQKGMQLDLSTGEAVIKNLSSLCLSINETLMNYAHGNNFDCFYIFFKFAFEKLAL